MENSLCLQAVLGISLVTIVCLTIGISYEDTMIIIILASVVIFLLNIGKIYYEKHNRQNNITPPIPIQNMPPPSLKNAVLNNSNNLVNLENNSNNESKLENMKLKIEEPVLSQKSTNQKPFYLENSDDNIMDARTYNLDDCTTDLSCIQKPDTENLFTGFEKIDTYLSPDSKFDILDKPITNSSIKKDNIVVENFQSSPLELNDVVKPFNNAVINPYKNYTMEEEILPDETTFMSSQDIGDQLCFNCKIGHCQGGVCRDINELRADDIKKVVKNVNQMKKVHPFSKNFPTILATNPDAKY